MLTLSTEAVGSALGGLASFADGVLVDGGDGGRRCRERGDVLDDRLDFAVCPLDGVTGLATSLEAVEDALGDVVLESGCVRGRSGRASTNVFRHCEMQASTTSTE